MLPEPIAVTLLVVEAFDQLGVPYFIGGSLACAVHGVSRATLDADLVAELKMDQIPDFVRRLSGAFYLDDEAIRSAILQNSSFNLIHLETSFKVDVFIRKTRPYDQVQLSRRTLQILAAEPERSAYFASAEDIILAKLEWYRLGGEASPRQWRDVVNVMKVQGSHLDMDYLRKWAVELGISGLLEGAILESNLDG